jgi:tetratricopeptide (TPR) repeat protein
MRIVVITIIGLLLACGACLNSKAFQTPDSARELARAQQLTDQIVALINERRYDEAHPLAQQAAEIRQRLLPSDDIQLGIAFSYLAELYLVKKKEQDAEKTFQRALTVFESHPEQNQLAISKTLERLSYLRLLKHDYESAEPLAWRALLIREKELGRSDPKTISAMQNYACIGLIARTLKGRPFVDKLDQNKTALRRLSLCWVGGLTDDCNEQTKVDTEDEDIVHQRALELAQPEYPVVARQKKLTGYAFVALLLNDRGELIAAKPVCGGFPELNAAALTAVRKSRFPASSTPGKQTTGIVKYRFYIQ